MSILIKPDTKVLVQGITGAVGVSRVVKPWSP